MGMLPVTALLFAAAVPHAGVSQGGARLYAASCASCHGARAEGTAVAPPLVGKSAADIHFMLDTGRMPAPVAGANEVAREPSFTAIQIDELVRYVQHFSPMRVHTSLPSIAPGDPARGRALFAANCAQCHGAAADGASVGAQDVAPSLRGVSPMQIAEAVRAGPSVMPRFGPDVLSARDVDDVASYVTLVQTHGSAAKNFNAGGLSLAHAGPVAEGFVAWLFGIGALVLFVRAIGIAGREAPTLRAGALRSEPPETHDCPGHAEDSQ